MFNLRAAFFVPVLALGLLSAGSPGPVFSQNGGSRSQQSSSSPIVGTWLTAHPLQDGSTLLSADHYEANGTWSLNVITRGGVLEGSRSQVWGRYTVQPIGNNRYQITTIPSGWAPLQVCTQYVGCETKPAWKPSTTVRTVLDSNHLAGADGAQWERSAQIPAGVASRIPQTVYQVPPALPSTAGGGYNSGGGGYKPIPRPAGVGGTCDDLQQQRICTINDGYMYTGRDGCQHCSK